MRYPRFNDADIVTLKGAVFNQVFDDLEMLRGVQFSQDFVVDQNSAGSIVSLQRSYADCTLLISGTAAASGLYQCKQVIGQPLQVDPSTSLDIPQTGESFPSAADAYFENIPELGLTSSHYISSGTKVDGIYKGLSTDSPPLPVYRGTVQPACIFVVNLTQTGGSNGTQTTAAAWIYTATSLAGATLGTGLNQQRPQPKGTTTPATMGYGYYLSGGFVLAEAWEVPGTGGC